MAFTCCKWFIFTRHQTKFHYKFDENINYALQNVHTHSMCCYIFCLIRLFPGNSWFHFRLLHFHKNSINNLQKIIRSSGIVGVCNVCSVKLSRKNCCEISIVNFWSLQLQLKSHSHLADWILLYVHCYILTPLSFLYV